MVVDKDIKRGTAVILPNGKVGEVSRTYPGSKVVTVRERDGSLITYMHTELSYSADRKAWMFKDSAWFPTRLGDG
jgi:hypothetical protein